MISLEQFDKAVASARTACICRQNSNGGWELVGPAAPPPITGNRRPGRGRTLSTMLRIQVHFAVRRLLPPERHDEYLNHPCRESVGHTIRILAKADPDSLPRLEDLVVQQLMALNVEFEHEQIA